MTPLYPPILPMCYDPARGARAGPVQAARGVLEHQLRHAVAEREVLVPAGHCSRRHVAPRVGAVSARARLNNKMSRETKRGTAAAACAKKASESSERALREFAVALGCFPPTWNT